MLRNDALVGIAAGGREAVPAVEGKGMGLSSWRQKPILPVQLGLEEHFAPCVCGSKEHVFWTWRAAFVLALRYQCWTGFMIRQ